MLGGHQAELLEFFLRYEHPFWRPCESDEGGSIEDYGELDRERINDLEWIMFTLIREGKASMSELKTVYTLDEALLLYDMMRMQSDIERIDLKRQREKEGE